MNYLFHLYLSGDDPEILTGNFMGDFVKGPLDQRYPPRLLRGIELHRRIDTFAHHNPSFNRSRHRLAPSLGLYRGVLVDLFYDHFLATNWDEVSPEPLAAYLQRARGMVEGNLAFLPDRLRGLVPVIFEDMIPSYLESEGIKRALDRMSRRIRRPNPLAEGWSELPRHYQGLREDFFEFLTAARDFAADFDLSDPRL